MNERFLLGLLLNQSATSNMLNYYGDIDSDQCICGQKDSAHHYIFECELRESKYRKFLKEKLEEKSIENIISDPQCWDIFVSTCK